MKVVLLHTRCEAFKGKRMMLQVFLLLQDICRRNIIAAACVFPLDYSSHLLPTWMIVQPTYIHTCIEATHVWVAPPLLSDSKKHDSNQFHTVVSNEAWQRIEVNNISWLHSKHFWIWFYYFCASGDFIVSVEVSVGFCSASIKLFTFLSSSLTLGFCVICSDDSSKPVCNIFCPSNDTKLMQFFW